MFNKRILILLSITCLLLCLSVVSANETKTDITQNNIIPSSDYNNNNHTYTKINKNNIESNIAKTANTTSSKSDVTITTSNQKAYSGQNLSVTSKVTSKSSTKVNISTAILKINNKTITTSKVTNGVATFNFIVPSLKSGNHNLTIKTGETSKYNSNEITKTLSIYKRNVTITASNITSYAGKNITYKATVKCGNTNVNITTAVVKIAGKSVAKTSVTNGVATFKFTTPDLKKGTYNIVIKTGDTVLYNSASKSTKLTVYRQNITITSSNVTSYAGKSVSLTAKFTTKGTKAINNIPAILKINGSSIAKTNVTNGVATFKFTTPTLKKGTYNMLIKIGDSTFYNTANITKKLNIYARNISISTTTLKGYAGKQATLTANFTTGSTKVNITTSVLKINGKTLATSKVTNGVAKYSFTIPNISAGKYTLTIKTGDTTLYNSANKTTTLTILENPDTKVSVVQIKVSSNTTSTTSGRLVVTGTTTAKNGNYYTTSSDTNSVLVQNGGVLSLINSTVKKTGDLTNTQSEDSEFYGTNSAVLVTAKSTAYIANTSIMTNATGANAMFSSNLASSASGATINISNVNISTYKDKSRGLDATYGGIINAEYVTINTRGGSCAALATDRGEGTVNAYNCVLNTGVGQTNGQGSPCIYSTGAISAVNCTGTAYVSQIGCIEGKNSITLNECNLTGYAKGNRQSNGVYVDLGGFFIYQSMSGDADLGTSILNATNSKLTISSDSSYYNSAPMFHVTNTAAKIYLNNCTLSYGSGILLNNSGQDQWGTSGSNGGDVAFVATNQKLTGNIYTDKISTLNLTLKTSTLKGAVNPSSSYGTTKMTITSGSTWTLTGNSHITSLQNSGTINYGSYTLYVNGVAYTASNPY